MIMIKLTLIALLIKAEPVIKFLDISLPEVKSNLKLTYSSVFFSNETIISQTLINNINLTSSTLDIAIYSLTNQSISDAIIKAYERGVKVRVIIEYSKVNTSTIDPAVKSLIDKKIPLRYLRGSGLYGVMHNKIAIFDKKILMTGSYNFTTAADNNNFENAVFVYDEKNISSYLNYFETMWSKATDVNSQSKSLYVEDFSTSLFTMIQGIRETLIKLIDGTQETLDAAVYSISDDSIYQALKRAKDRGVKIKIVTDRLQATQSETVKKLWSDGFDIKISNGYKNGVMHNKYAIFDKKMIITGSFNWSNNAESYNWENAIVLSGSYISPFINNFQTIYNQAWYLSEKDFQDTTSQPVQSR